MGWREQRNLHGSYEHGQHVPSPPPAIIVPRLPAERFKGGYKYKYNTKVQFIRISTDGWPFCMLEGFEGLSSVLVKLGTC